MKPRALYLAEIVEAINETEATGDEREDLSTAFYLGVRVGNIAAVCSVYTGGDAADVLDEAIAMATHSELAALN